MNRFSLTFALPEPSAKDVTRRELSISTTGDDEPFVQSLNGAARESDLFVCNENDELSITLVDIDAAGNRSPASAAFVYRVVDDVAPPAPGMVGVASKTQLDPIDEPEAPVNP